MTDRRHNQKAQHRLLGPGPRHVGAKVRHITRPLLKSRGLAQGDVVFRWQEIVGPELGALCYPMKLHSPRGSEGGTLTVRVSGAAALEFEYLRPQVIERINTFYGYQAVSHIRIEQGPLPRQSRKIPQRKRALSDAEKTELSESVKSIKNPDLRASLEDLGALIKASQKPR